MALRPCTVFLRLLFSLLHYIVTFDSKILLHTYYFTSFLYVGVFVVMLAVVFVHFLSALDVTLEEFIAAAMVNPLLTFHYVAFTVKIQDMMESYVHVITLESIA